MSHAKDVSCFRLYSSYRDSLALLSDSDRGQLLMSLFDYADGADTSSTLTPPAQMAFAFIAARMGSELDRSRHRSEVNRANAAKRWPLRTPREGEDAAEDG